MEELCRRELLSDFGVVNTTYLLAQSHKYILILLGLIPRSSRTNDLPG